MGTDAPGCFYDYDAEQGGQHWLWARGEWAEITCCSPHSHALGSGYARALIISRRRQELPRHRASSRPATGSPVHRNVILGMCQTELHHELVSCASCSCLDADGRLRCGQAPGCWQRERMARVASGTAGRAFGIVLTARLLPMPAGAVQDLLCAALHRQWVLWNGRGRGLKRGARFQQRGAGWARHQLSRARTISAERRALVAAE